MNTSLNGKRIAILLTDGFEQVEMTSPRDALLAAGATVELVAPRPGEVTGWHHTDPGDRFKVDRTLDQLSMADFDALLLPGGVINADQIRSDSNAQKLVREADRSDKPIAVICHGGWLLASSAVVRDRNMTSWPSLRDDLSNAGANWLDQEVVIDGNLISSRKPDDLPAFNKALLSALAA